MITGVNDYHLLDLSKYGRTIKCFICGKLVSGLVWTENCIHTTQQKTFYVCRDCAKTPKDAYILAITKLEFINSNTRLSIKAKK